MVVMDRSFRILWFNSKAAHSMSRQFGEELKSGYTYWDYVDKDSNLRFIRNFELALTGKVMSTERHVVADAEDEVWIEGSFSPLRTEDGGISGVIYSYQDISHRKRQEREARYRASIIRAINTNDSQAFVLIDEFNRIAASNLAAVALLSSSSLDTMLEGRKINDCIAPEWRERFIGGLKVARSGGTVVVEFDVIAPFRQTIEVRFCPVNAPGEASMVSVWAFDITDKKRAEQELRVSEENLRSVFNSSSQTFYLLDRNLTILAFNEPARAIVKEQYGFDLFIGDNVAKVTPPERMPQFLAETARAFGGRRVQVEKHFSNNGKEYWFERHINPIRNMNGEIDRVALWSIDITDRKKAEEALKENESKFRKLATLMPVGIYQTDANGNTIYVNDSLQKIIQASVADLISGDWKQQVHSDDMETVSKVWDVVSEKTERFEMEYRVLGLDGTITHVLEQALPLYNQQKQYIGYLGTVIDFTAQRTNQNLQQAKDVAERSLRFRSEFLASMSHEIRTPLTGILAMAELLLGSELAPEQRQRVDSIFKASTDLRSIVNDVLHLSELEAGKITLSEDRFTISQLLGLIHDRFVAEAEAKGIALHVEHHTDGNIRITSDRRRLTQILSNLTRNAIKFTTEGEVRVVALRDDDKLRIEVHDTGVGIPESELHKLFKDFSQLEHTTAQSLEGTGLGLSITRKLATMLGGTVGVESEYGIGSVFWFEMPMMSADVAIVEVHTETLQPIERGSRILLVEDNLINQHAFNAMLTKMGCKVIVATNGKQALQAYEENAFDLIFMDVQMPVMDGIEATKLIRGKGGAVPPIIGLSGNVLERDEDGYLKVPMDDLLVKPVVSRDLERMIQKWVIPFKK